MPLITDYKFYRSVNFSWQKSADAMSVTEINSHFLKRRARIEVRVTVINTVVPSLFVIRKLGEKQSLKFNYSKRIERPDYGDLNPFINYKRSQENVFTGNPDLKPEFSNRF
jgi:outer membrane receptor protein involved in Fe transport